MLTREPEDVGGRRPPGIGPPEALHERIRAAVANTPAPGIRTGQRIALALLLAVLLATAAVWLASEIVYQQQAVGLRVGAQSGLQTEWVLVLLSGLLGASTYIALRRGKHGLGAGAASLAIAAILVAPVYALLTLPAPVHVPDAGVPGIGISTWGWRCMVLAAVVGLSVLVSFTVALRRAVPVAGRLRGSVLGAAAGAWAGLAVFVFCPSGEYPHLIAGHVLPVVVLTIVGLLALPRALRP